MGVLGMGCTIYNRLTGVYGNLRPNPIDISHGGRRRPTVHNEDAWRWRDLSIIFIMAENPSPQLEKRPSASRSAVQEVSGLPERGRDEKGDEDDVRPMSSFLPQVNVKNDGLRDLMSVRVWRNNVLWRAGVSALKGPEHISTNLHLLSRS